MSRRDFTRLAVAGAAALAATGALEESLALESPSRRRLRLGGPVFGRPDSPESWVAALQEAGYRAAYCPLEATADDTTVRAWRAAADRADLVIAEVGAWSNPISPDEAERQKALQLCRDQLALAERIGARCCVNISGTRLSGFSGPHPDNLTRETFEMIVETTRAIIDAVRPTRTFYALETMPYAYPDSADCYLELIRAIDRPAMAAHLDPVNLVSSPQRYFRNGELIRECFAKLGPYLKSCHAKDTLLRRELTTHLDEVQPGLGTLDYAVYLTELANLPDPPPLMLEHLKTAEEYRAGAEHIRGVARKVGLSFE